MIAICRNWQACYEQLIKAKGDFGGNEDVILEKLADECYLCMNMDEEGG